MSRTSNSKQRTNMKALIIACIAVVLVIAIVFAVLYFAFPETWDNIISLIVDDEQSNVSNNNTGDNDLQYGDGNLVVHFLDVGQGDCIFIQFPDGKDMVIDCANYNNSQTYQDETFAYLDTYVTDFQLDYLMLTHCDSDHVYFMNELLDRYQVDNIFMPNVLAKPSNANLQAQIESLDTSMFTDKDAVTTVTYAEFFIAALTEPNCEIKLNVDPDNNTNSIVIEQTTYRFIFYCPTQQYYDTTGLSTAERKNAISPIGILEYNDRKIVFTGDSNEINEPTFVQRVGNIDCDVLKVGHHGSETSTTQAFLNAINVEYAVISCNKVGNTFSHPRQATLDRLIAQDITIYRTDNNGNIVLVVDEQGEISFTVENDVAQSVNQIGGDR